MTQARRVLRSLDESAWQAASYVGQARGYVRIAALPTAIQALLAPSICKFMDMHPEVIIDVDEATPAEISALLKDGEAGLALCRETQALPEGFVFEPLLRDRYVVAASPEHPLSRTRRISLEALRGETWLAMPVGTNPRAAFEELFAKGGKMPPILNVVSRHAILMSAILTQKNCVALLPAGVATEFERRRLIRSLNIEVPLTLAPLGVATRQDIDEGAASELRKHLRLFFHNRPRL